jgi:spermidine synthase
LALRPLALTIGLVSFSLVLYELVLTRIFAIVMFAQFAHLAISLALLGIAVGAMLLHLFPRLVPEDDLTRRLGWLALLTALAMVGSVVLAVHLPFNRVTDDLGDSTLVGFRTRQKLALDVFRPGLLALLAPAITLPFACAGAGFAAAFRSARATIGPIYAADLGGGALGCVLFLPLLGAVRGPDAVFAAALAALAGATVAFGSARALAAGAGALAAIALVASIASTRTGLLTIRYAAGFDERGVTEELWTPLTRLAVFENRGRAFVMLDNASRSEVILSESNARTFARGPFSIVFRLHQRPGRVAILAAGAGGEIVIARAAGHRDITAIEIASETFDIVRRRWRHLAINPFLQRGVKTVTADARSAIMHDSGRFDIIEMYQANFMSFGGMLSEAWNAGHLVTREAFGHYLDHLNPDGTVSVSSGPSTARWARTAAAALRLRGVREPARHMAVVKAAHGGYFTLLVKGRPFRPEEIERLLTLVRADGHTLLLNPGRMGPRWRDSLSKRHRILTDDRPHWDSFASIMAGLESLVGGSRGDVAPTVLLYRVLLTQLGILLAAGLVFLGIPYLWRGRLEVGRVSRPGAALGFFGAIGYGYLAVEMVLIHELVLLVGHPTYAVTLVLFVLLVASGLGSLVAGRMPEQTLARRMPAAIGAVIVLATLHAFALPPLLNHALLGLSLPVRASCVGVSLFPLGFVMGMPFPLALRRMPAAVSDLVPWCWAINGWTSVLAAVLTVFVSRLFGYAIAFTVAMVAYLLALALCTRIPRLERRAAAPAPTAEPLAPAAG